MPDVGIDNRFIGGGELDDGIGSEHCLSTLVGGTVKNDCGDSRSESDDGWVKSLSFFTLGCLINNLPLFVPTGVGDPLSAMEYYKTYTIILLIKNKNDALFLKKLHVVRISQGSANFLNH